MSVSFLWLRGYSTSYELVTEVQTGMYVITVGSEPDRFSKKVTLCHMQTECGTLYYLKGYFT